MSSVARRIDVDADENSARAVVEAEEAMLDE